MTKINEARIMDRDARINAYYVSTKGQRHRVAENIPYYLLDKLVSLLTKKYNITMNDIEVIPVDHSQYRTTHQPELAEGQTAGPNDVAELLYNTKPEIFSRFGDDFVMDAITNVTQNNVGSAQELAIKVAAELKRGMDEGILGFGTKKSVAPAKKPLDYAAIRQMAKDSTTQQQVFRSPEEFRNQKQPAMAEGPEEGITRRGILKGLAGAGALGAAGKASAIAGAFPSPSTREKWAKDAAASNAAEAKRLAAIKAKQDAERLQHGTSDIERLNKINYHGGKITPTNAEWDGDGDFMYLDGTQYSMASRMPIKGDEPRDMKLISTREGRQVYIWTRYRMKGDGGHYFYPAPAGSSQINEFAPEGSTIEDEIQHWKDMALHWARQGDEKAMLKCKENLRNAMRKKLHGVNEASFDREEFRRQMKDLEAREELRKTDPVSAKALDLRGQLPQQSKKKPEDDSMSINDPRHPQYAYTQAGQHQLDEFAPGNGDDGLPYAEYQVYQCNPEDQFEWIGGPLYQTDSVGMAHKYAYEQYVKHRPKAFMIWQERSQGSRGNYGVKGQSDHDEDDLNEDYLDEK